MSSIDFQLVIRSAQKQFCPLKLHNDIKATLQRNYKRASLQFLKELVQVLVMMPRFRETLLSVGRKRQQSPYDSVLESPPWVTLH